MARIDYQHRKPKGNSHLVRHRPNVHGADRAGPRLLAKRGPIRHRSGDTHRTTAPGLRSSGTSGLSTSLAKFFNRSARRYDDQISCHQNCYRHHHHHRIIYIPNTTTTDIESTQLPNQNRNDYLKIIMLLEIIKYYCLGKKSPSLNLKIYSQNNNTTLLKEALLF